jgi:thiol:disulfide interchange protein DsbA
MTRRLLLLLLALLMPMAACAAKPAADPVEGVDYALIEGGAPWRPLKPGQVEVAEIFAYTCPHCAHFHPALEAWKAKLPKFVQVRYLPAGYQQKDPLSRAFFASESLGTLARTHAATFRAIHDEQSLPMNPSEGEIATFYAGLGVDAEKFLAAMKSFDTAGQMTAARAFSMRSAIQGTPTLIVNGTYRIEGDTVEAQLRNARRVIDMVARQKK